MTDQRRDMASAWTGLSRRFLPFADAATDQLPLGRLLRLSLFQVSVGMALTLLTGTLNRVMIVELSVPAWLVALMVSLPLVFAPFRAFIGHKSDTHRSALGWRRGPYIWFGSLVMFGGLAIMPFALLVLSGDTHGPLWIGHVSAALAFLMVGAGLHTTQTAGLALATDLAPKESRPRVVALLYVMLLLGMAASALVFGALLANFNQLKLIQVIQGCAVLAMALNLIALWKQEGRNAAHGLEPDEDFGAAWREFAADPRARRLLVAVAVGAAAFSMQDILLEPYGAQILDMTVGETTRLTALFAMGTLLGFGLAARGLGRGGEPHRMAAHGLLVGVGGFSAVVFSDPLQSALIFQIGSGAIGLGGGLFSVCMLPAAMALAREGQSGIALGAWGAAQATAAGVALALGGALRDGVEAAAGQGWLGQGFAREAIGYSVVYHIEIFLLFVALAALGPIARHAGDGRPRADASIGLAAFPN